MMELRSGHPWPMGAHWDGQGVNFAVFSDHAERMDLCLFDESGTREVQRIALPQRSHDVWHGYLPGAAPGLIYGFRAHGPWRPDRGHRFNAHKLLLDPYAREIVGRFEWRDEHFAADRQHAGQLDLRDNAAHALKARVVAGLDSSASDRQLHTPTARTVLYEVHVKGFTRLHPGVPEPLRGTYAGLASDAAIDHLQRLGITAVSLLPVHQHLDEQRLVTMGLTNYWGYNTIGFFCPDPALASGAHGLSVREEFRAMVRRLHAAGIEVILDVVFNHTAESDELGPTLSMRGLDNASYYRLRRDDRSLYENDTGCGNTLDLRHPRVAQLVLDSLRFWAGEMGVDGFRFDLATVLGRGEHGFTTQAPFFTALAQDPLLSRLKMIAEPWDIGPGGYQLGGFPHGWLEWNDRFRDTLRRFWVSGHASRGDFALRLCGSSDVYQPRRRGPEASINYVVSHDGFTLHDLVSHAHRHNDANGENNRDGHGDNHSANFGVEGPTDDLEITTTRDRVKRALLACTLLSQGTPMLAAGDELGHTQNGNNNPYCQDNPTTWIDWSRADAQLLSYAQRVVQLRHRCLPLGSLWYHGLADRSGLQDLAWLRADGQEMQSDDWAQAGDPVFAALIGHPGRAHSPLLMLFNASAHDQPFRVPGGSWQALLDSSEPTGSTAWQAIGPIDFSLKSRSVVLLSASSHPIDT
jgi:glycogen debranching enzyme GlgX